MNWTNQARMLINILKEANLNVSAWKENENNSDEVSYYTDYNDSKHMGEERIMEYDFQTPIEFKKCLDMLWTDSECDGDVAKFVLRCMVQSRDKMENILPEVDVHNYMM